MQPPTRALHAFLGYLDASVWNHYPCNAPKPLHSPIPEPQANQYPSSPDSQTSLFNHLFSLTCAYIYTEVDFLSHRCDSVMPLFKNYIWFHTISEPKVQTQQVCPKAVHISLNLLLNFLRITFAYSQHQYGLVQWDPGPLQTSAAFSNRRQPEPSHETTKEPPHLPL